MLASQVNLNLECLGKKREKAGNPAWIANSLTQDRTNSHLAF